VICKQNNKWIGALITLIFSVVFFALYSNFELSGGAIDYQNTSSSTKLLATVALLPLGLYLGLLFYGGKRIALQLGGGLALLLVFSYLAGFLLHH
jgi:hypothetical protein